ncbi:MAG: tRNA pseudouridine(54/55) synthase Pus10 [Promethearchaeota archaeon]
MLEKVKRILAGNRLCDHCLGRQFSLLGTSTTNRDRGYALKLALTMEAHGSRLEKPGGAEAGVATRILTDLAVNGNFLPARRVLEKLGETVPEVGDFQCDLCGSLFRELPAIASRVVERLSEYEFPNFLVGTRLAPAIVDREDEFRQKYELLQGEAMKSHVNRELGKVVQKELDKPVEFSNPSVVVLLELDPGVRSITVQANPLCIYGLYRKLERGLPQTHWPCVKCKGKGCEACNQTGKQYPDSVEELLSPPILQAAGGTSTKFHGAGREDADARCLGDGRPFIIEVKDPKRRTFDLGSIEAELNSRNEGRVQVSGLRFVDRSMIKAIKEHSQGADKTYDAQCSVEGGISREEFEGKLAEAKQVVLEDRIAQRTPLRVVHRRADKTRYKRIFELDGEWVDEATVKFRIRSQGGTYIKEFISGDEGRTEPSLTGIFGKQLTCTALDVIEIATPDPRGFTARPDAGR